MRCAAIPAYDVQMAFSKFLTLNIDNKADDIHDVAET